MDYAGIHSLLVDPRDADHLTVGVSGGGVYDSADGGRHWDEIEKIDPSTFGFAFSVHPRDADTAWLVPWV